MDPRFDDIFTRPENDIFKIVFFPDRVYHARYLNATRSDRYRYNVREVRGKHDILVMKGQVYLDGLYLTNFLRLEYRGGRLVEQVREKNRLLRERLKAWVRLLPDKAEHRTEATVHLEYCRWVDAWQVEIWQDLEPPPGSHHAASVLDMMGHGGSITRVSPFIPALADLKGLRQLEIAFRENDRDLPFGYRIADEEAAWDNNYLRSYQVPNNAQPSSAENTVESKSYLIDFQRGWYMNAADVEPVRYRNAMMNDADTERADDNVIEMRWLLQRELGGSLVFFHEVVIPPGRVEGAHRHIGSEELYYVVAGEGIAYIGENDDPQAKELPVVERSIFGLDVHRCRELPVRRGSVVYTKSGGIHGIRNTGTEDLKFVAFLYQSS